MRFMANSRLGDGITAEQVSEHLKADGATSEAWELIRHHIVTDYAFKGGDEPGVVLFLRAESEEEARAHVDSLPIVTQGLLRFDIDPLDKVMHL